MRYLLIASLLALLILAGCANTGAPPTSPPTSTVTHVQIEVSWAVGYDNLHDLKAGSDAVVVGTVVQAQPSVMKNRGNVTTDFVVSIDKLVSDPKGLLGQSPSFLLHQMGGIITDDAGNETIYEVTDDPLFKTGEQYVLFLNQNEPPLFFVAGGPSGRFRIQNGLVSPEIAGEGVKMQPTSLDDFLAQVEQA